MMLAIVCDLPVPGGPWTVTPVLCCACARIRCCSSLVGIGSSSGSGSPLEAPSAPTADPARADGASETIACKVSGTAADLSLRELRHPERRQTGSAARQAGGCDPRSVVELVMRGLSRRGIRPGFGPGADLASAESSAALLLAALGVDLPDGREPAC